jgi:ribosomal protein S18 acetylase RimI-like enzyme
MNIRTHVKKEDLENVRRITESTKFFHDHEVDVAVSLVEDTLREGEAAGYYFLFIEDDNHNTVGFTCFGEIPCTRQRYDIYWIVVDDSQRGKGLGKFILKETEKEIARIGGEIAYLETSSIEKYHPTRVFYEKLDYTKEVELKDFYDNGDSKVIYSKRVK